jgi:hypothetical protein
LAAFIRSNVAAKVSFGTTGEKLVGGAPPGVAGAVGAGVAFALAASGCEPMISGVAASPGVAVTEGGGAVPQFNPTDIEVVHATTSHHCIRFRDMRHLSRSFEPRSARVPPQ